MITKISTIFIVSLGLCNTQSMAMGNELAVPAAIANVDVKHSAEKVTEENTYTANALTMAIRFSNYGLLKTLLKHPLTPIANQSENRINLIDAVMSAAEQSDPRKDKKIIKMLLFFGFNPTFKLRSPSAQEFARTLDSHDKDYSTWMDNYKNIEKFCMPQELAEFRAVKKIRMLKAHETDNLKIYKNFPNLMRREIGGLNIKRKVKTAAAPANAAPFTWPSTKDSKENSK